MTIRTVLMWYLGAIVVIGGSGAAGFTALKQHRALLAEQTATQVAALPTEQVAEPTVAPPVATAAVQAPAVAPAPLPSPAAPTKTAASPPGLPWPPLPNESTRTRVAASPSVQPWPALPKAFAAHNSIRRHAPRVVIASSHHPVGRPKSSHRPAFYATAHVPSAPRVTYYAYPGYYPYQPGYAYYSYYPRYPYYSTY